MSRYQFTSQAQQDLIQIRRFTVNQWGAKQSIIYLEELKNTVELLSTMPLMGKNCADDLGKDIYRFLYGSPLKSPHFISGNRVSQKSSCVRIA